MIEWFHPNEKLPEKSEREAEKALDGLYHRVLVSIRLSGMTDLHTYVGFRALRKWMGSSDGEVSEQVEPAEWFWNVSYLTPDCYEVVAWAWLPDITDPDWVRDKMPENCGCTRNILGTEMCNVLAQIRQIPTGALHVEMRNRFLCPAPLGSGDWAWALEEFGKVEAWMPMPEYSEGGDCNR